VINIGFVTNLLGGLIMVQKFAPYGSDVSSGTYKCADCGYIYSNQSKKSLPPCPDYNKKPHSKNGWYIMSGQGDSVKDPHPHKK
jgi:hypothetical protein